MNKKNKAIFGFSVKDIAEIAIFCALAILLDQFIKIEIGATGGSLNISMVPLYIIALRHGPFKGFVAGGLVYGIISCLWDGYGISTFPLEYFVSFGAVAILGAFAGMINDNLKQKKAVNIVIAYAILIGSVALAAGIRLVCASIDSVWLWEYSWGDAFVYNVTYVLPSALAVCIILCLLLPFIKLTNREFPTSYLENYCD